MSKGKIIKLDELQRMAIYMEDSGQRDVMYIMTHHFIQLFPGHSKVTISQYHYDILLPALDRFRREGKHINTGHSMDGSNEINANFSLRQTSVVFSGFRSNELEQYLQSEFDCTMQKAVIFSTDLLITKTSKKTRKIEKAIDMGIAVMSIDQLNGVMQMGNHIWE